MWRCPTESTRGGVGPAGPAGNFGVENVEALKAVNTAPLPDFAMIGTTGYWEDGDGGGAIYYYLSEATDTPDDAMVIEPDSGNGRFFLWHHGVLNVRWFGAKGDDSTDDSAAINAASTVAGNLANGTEVYIPTGIFICPAAIEMHSHVTYRIHGTIKKPDNFGEEMVGPTTSYGFGMWAIGSRGVDADGYSLIENEDIHIIGDGLGVVDGNSLNADPDWRSKGNVFYSGIAFYNTANYSISGLTVKNFGVYHIYNVAGTNGFIHHNIVRAWEGANEAVNNGQNQAGIGLQFCNGMIVSNNSVWSSDDSIELSAGFSWIYSVSANNIIAHNELQQKLTPVNGWTPHSRNIWIGVPDVNFNGGNNQSGLQINILVQGNVCKTAAYGFMTGGTWSGGEQFREDVYQNISVVDNEWRDVPSGTHAVVNHVIVLTGTTHARVAGNLINNFAMNGIGFKGCKHVTIDGNMFHNQTAPTGALANQNLHCITPSITVGAAAPFRDNEDIIIENNTAWDCVGGFISDGFGFESNFNKRMTIHGNKCRNMAMGKSALNHMEQACVGLTQVSDLIVDNNEFLDCAGPGILIVANPGKQTERIEIASNVIRGMGVGATVYSSATVSRAKNGANVATIVTATPHGLVANSSYVIVSGLGGTGYNQTFPVIVTSTPTTTSFTYQASGGAEATTPDAGGTVTLRAYNSGILVRRDPSDTESINTVWVTGNTVSDSTGFGGYFLNINGLQVRDNVFRHNGSMLNTAVHGNFGQVYVIIAGVSGMSTVGWSGSVENNVFDGAITTGAGMTFGLFTHSAFLASLGTIGTASRERTSNIATITTSAPHGLTPSVSYVTISGVGGSGYNATSQTLVSTTPSPLMFTYVSTGADEASTPDVGGTITVRTYAGAQMSVKGNVYVDCIHESWRGSDSGMTGTMVYERTNSVPVNTFFRIGDICWYTQPVAGGAPGAMCTESGSPATWKDMSPLAI